MDDLQAGFEQASREVQALPERPGNLEMLRLYALYKQATEGDAAGERPSMTDIVGRYKFDAWAALAGTTADAARQSYIDLVEELKKQQGVA